MAQAAPAHLVPVTTTTPRAFFSEYSDENLISVGVPPALLPHVRDIQLEDDVDRLENILPREAFEGVFMMGAGYSVDVARAELGIARQAAVDTTDFAAAVERDSTKRQFVV